MRAGRPQAESEVVHPPAAARRPPAALPVRARTGSVPGRVAVGERSPVMTATVTDHPLSTVLRRYWSQYQRLHERRRLLDRPWLEDVLHWSADGELHGHVPPTPAGRPRSVTSDGWCPGRR